VFLPLLILWIVLSVSQKTFLTSRNITNLLFESAVVGAMAFGTTGVLITGEIDLSLGAVEGLSGIMAATAMTSWHGGWLAGVVVALATGAAVGLLNGFFTASLRIPSFIVTLAMLGVATGIADVVSGGLTIYNFPQGFLEIGQGGIGEFTYPIFISIGVAVLLHLLLRHTRIGLMLYGVGSNASAADLIGISVRRVKILAFVISGLCAAVGGIMVAAELGAANPELGSDNLLNAIAAVIIGGTALTGGEGSILGTALGVLIITSIKDGLDLLNVNPFWQQLVIGLVILGVGGMGVLTERGTLRSPFTRVLYRLTSRGADGGRPADAGNAPEVSSDAATLTPARTTSVEGTR
jgi:ribose/xylose/arabinose/galactoside ABC-type transport system permease subunit